MRGEGLHEIVDHLLGVYRSRASTEILEMIQGSRTVRWLPTAGRLLKINMGFGSS